MMERNSYAPTSDECISARVDILKHGTAEHPMFSIQPLGRLENSKDVRSSVRIGRSIIVGGSDDLDLRLEFIEPALWDIKRDEFLISTNTQVELKDTIVLLAKKDIIIEELLPEIVRSERILRDYDEREADHVVAQYLRAERRSSDHIRDQITKAMEKAMLEGIFIFRGKPTPLREAGHTIEDAMHTIISTVAKDVFQYYHLAPIRLSTDSAAKFLGVERLDRIIKDLDPLILIIKSQGSSRVNTTAPVLAEVLRVFHLKASEIGAGRLQGTYLQEIFSSPPYGWTKDTIRYLFSILLRAGEIEFHIPGINEPVRTAGPQNIDN